MSQVQATPSLKERVDHWLAHGGEEELVRALALAEKAKHEIRNVLRVDYETLRHPMTF